ncbi:imine reductase family protein, partial [Streptomyces sp. NPDC002143]
IHAKAAADEYQERRSLFTPHPLQPFVTTWMNIDPGSLAPLLADWLVSMAPAVHQTAAQLSSGDYTKGVVSNLAMQVAGTPTFLNTAEDQGVSPELLRPYFDLMRRRLAEGSGAEDLTGVVDLLVR